MTKKVLVVDDEPNIVRIIGCRLKSKGFEVIVAGDGQGALKLAVEEEPDIIVLDLMMPHPNGYEVCRILKEDPKYAHIPIILLTAKNVENQTGLGDEIGADAFVEKPYEPDELLKAIENLLGCK